MKMAAFIGVFLLGLSIASWAQTNPAPSCPAISISGPAGTTALKVPARFTATIDTKGRQFDLKYFWNVTSGKIVSGQGTTSIEVVQTEPVQIIALEIKGLPGRCPNTETLSFSIEHLLEPIKLTQFEGLKFVAHDAAELSNAVRTMGDNPNNQLYIIVGHKKAASEEILRTLEKDIVDYLSKAIPERNAGDTTIVRYPGNADLVQVWRIPPGADNPTCTECDESVCPTISVTGPAGIWTPGDTISFTASIEGNIPPNISYHWSLSDGKSEITDGKGTSKIAVRTPRYPLNLVATIDVKGLPKECPSAASETAGASDYGPEAILIDESSVALDRINKGGLDKLVAELKRVSSSFGYIIEYVPAGTAQKTLNRKIRLVSDYLNKTGRIDTPRFKIIFEEVEASGRSTENRTKLYAIPVGADFPAP